MKRSAVVPAVLLLGFVVAACGPSRNGDKVEFKVPVSVQEVELGDVEDRIVVTGSLRASEIVSLTVETRGMLNIARGRDGRLLGEGDRVSSGQVIAEITGEDVRVAARTAATRRRFLTAQSDYEAAEKLFAEGLSTETDLRAAETALEEARLEYDRSRLTEVRNRLVTPMDGVLMSLARDGQGRVMANGQLVSPGFVVATVAPTGVLVADVDVVGIDVARVEEGQVARVTHHAFPGRVFEGEVLRLAPNVDPVTRALRAEIEVDNGSGVLRPGMYVEVAILVEQRPGVTVVPRQAVTERGGKKVVFVLVGQRVAQREVELGLGDDETVEIRSGLEKAERIVVRGIETLADGSRVRVTSTT